MKPIESRLKSLPLFVWLAVLVLAFGFGLRIFALDAFPPGVQHDEVFVANFAETVLHGQFPIFFELNRGNEPLFMYLVAGMFKLFGENVWALRATAGLCGFGALVLTYLLARDLFNRVDPRAAVPVAQVNADDPWARWGTRGDFVALITIAGIAVSFWSLYESRIGLHAISTYLLAAATFYAFWRGWTRGERITLILSGVLAGLATYTYRSGTFVPLTLLGFVIYTLVFHRAVWGKNLWLAPVIFVIAAAIYAPLFYFITSHPETALARVGDLSGDMDALRQGNPVPMLTNAARVFGLFGISGDPEWRYNVALRPIFDPAWAVLFYAGLLLALWRIKRAPYAFVVIWLVGMLLPSIITGSDLSQHRAVGAIGAAFMLPAVMLDEIRMWVTARWQKAGQAVFGAATVVLIALAAVGGLNAYFVTWANNPEVRLIQRSDLAAAAHWLDQHQGAERALVSAEFANDLDRGAFNLEAAQPNRAQFFQGADTFVIPAQTGAYVVNTRSGPINDAFRSFLPGAPVYETKLPDGRPETQIYHLDEQALATLRAGMARAGQTMDGQLIVARADVAAQAKTGDKLPVKVWWQIGSPQVTDADGLAWTATLQDKSGYDWSDATSMGYTPSQWQSGDTVVSLLPLNVPPDAPPRDYKVNLSLASAKGNVPLQQGEGAPSGALALASTGIARGAVPDSKPDLPIRYPSKFKFGDLQLLGSDAQGEAAAGGTWQLVLFWLANNKLPGNYTLRLIATTEDGKEITHQDTVLGDDYPTRRWRAGDYVRTIEDLGIPGDAPRGKAVVRLAILNQDGKPVGRADGAPIAGIEISGRAHTFDKPAVETPQSLRFGDAIELAGYDMPQKQAVAGKPFSVKLAWHALKPADKPYTVFVHLLDANGKVVGQKDAPPLNGDAPTDGWQAGEYLTDEYTFDVAADAPAGAGSIEIGLYDPATGQRLALTDRAGAGQGDHVTIESILITH